MTENTTIEKEYILERPEDEVALLGVQDQFVTLLEEGLNVTVKPLVIQSKSPVQPKLLTKR